MYELSSSYKAQRNWTRSEHAASRLQSVTRIQLIMCSDVRLSWTIVYCQWYAYLASADWHRLAALMSVCSVDRDAKRPACH